MALGFVEAVRNAMLDVLTTQVGTSGLWQIYDGTRPATGGTATTKLAELTCNATAFAAAASGGVLTLNAITNDSSANASGTATWFRIATSGDAAKIDGSVTATSGGGDLELSTTAISAGDTVSISSATITAGNA